MDKIYSRNRIRFPSKLPKIRNFFPKSNLPNKNDKNLGKIVKIIVVLSIAFLVVYSTLGAIYPIFEALCIKEAKALATKISNEQATKVMANYEYEDLCTVVKDKNDNVTMIKANVIPINEIISDIPIKIQEELDKKGKSNFSIALGSFTGSKLFSGIGPNIHFQVAQIGNIDTDLKSEFTAQGINQTLHRVYLQVKCKVQILTPINTIDAEITNQVLLAEAVIVGNVPESYYNLEGLDKSNLVDVIK